MHKAHKKRRRISLSRKGARKYVAMVEPLERRQLLSGTWTALTNAAPFGVGTMLLLPNGQVLTTNGSASWALLTPSSTGSYVGGTWRLTATANYSRLYDSSDVLQNGNVFVAGGEYGNGGSTGEIYNPLDNTWTDLPAQNYGAFIDSWSSLIPNGDVLITPVAPNPGGYTTLFNPNTNTWSQGPTLPEGVSADEQSWVKLADGSILTVNGSTSYRYIPAENEFIMDASLPANLTDSLGEYGPAFLLPDGNAFFIGANGLSAIYTPSGSTAPGSWVAGPTIPGGLGEDDASGASLRDGTVLITAGPADSYNGPTSLFLYNPTTNSYSSVANPDNSGNPPYYTRMLALPNGDVLYTDGGNTIYQYDPGTTALSQALPTITSVARNSNGTMTLTGTNLNGINTGAEYGDDAQMDSNYPLIRLTSGSNVYYASSYDWSNTGVQLGTTSETVQFTLPLGIPAGTYSLVAVANGVPSAATSLTISTTANNSPPTVSTPAAASPSPVAGTTVALSVQAADDGGASNLTYTWQTTSAPSVAPLPSFSNNGANSANDVTAIFHQAGSYTFKVTITDSGGLSVTSSVSVVVNQTLSSVSVTPSPVNLTAGQSQQLTATGYDQFGNTMTPEPTFTWALTSGIGDLSTTGLFQSTADGTLATVTATTGSFVVTDTIGIVKSPWISTDIGGPGIAGVAYDSTSTTTLTGSGDDIWNGSDQFHFDYQSITGNATIVAEVDSTPVININGSTTGAAKAGVMFRGSTEGNASFVDLVYTNGQGLQLLYRNGAGATAAQSGSDIYLTGPVYLKLVRAGSLYTGYYSTNGTTWTEVSSYTNTAVGTAADCGLVACSHSNSELAQITYSNVTISQPTVATAAAANPSPVSGTQTALSVLGANLPDTAGESTLTYTWAATSIPTGASAPTFSVNGTNAAKDTLATFTSAGSYTFTVTITDQFAQSVTSSVTVTVNSTLTSQALTSSAVTPGTASLSAGQTEQFTATAYDQFGIPMQTQPAFTWAVKSGGGAISSTGLYTAPSSGTLATISATTGSISSTATVGVVNTPWTSVDIGAPPLLGNAYDFTSSTTLTGCGSDIWNTSDQFHFDYQTITGNATLVAELDSTPLTNKDSTSSAYAKGGIMFRTSTAANSSFVQLVYTNDLGLELLYRSGDGVPAQQQGNNISVSGAVYLKLTRSGSVFTGYYSSNGTAWTLISSVTNLMVSNTALTGLVACSHNTAEIADVTFSKVSINQVAVATAAAAAPNPVTATTASLSVLGANSPNSEGEASLIYTWAATTIPTGATAPGFSLNGINSAKNTTVTFHQAGSYAFTVTIADAFGDSVTSSVNVTVDQTLSGINLSSGVVVAGQTTQATVSDQFGNVLPTQPSWSATGGSISSSGLFTAGSAGGTYTITATLGATSLQTNVSIVPASYTGTSGADTYAICLSPSNSSLEQIFVNTPETSSPTYTIAISELSTLSFTTDSDGSVTVDFTNGDPLPANGISYSGGDALIIDGSPGGGMGFNINATQVIDTAAAASPISYSNVQSVAFDLSGGNNSLTQLAQPSAAVSYNAGPLFNSLTIDGGLFTISSDPQSTSGSLTVNDNAALLFSPPTPGSGYSPRNLYALVLGPNAVATVGASPTSSDRTVLETSQLSLASTAQLDLTNNAMIVHNGNLTNLTPLLAQGFNANAGYWNGDGITSSSAAADSTYLTALGVISNDLGGSALYTTFDNQPVVASDVLIKYTYYGDTNLDGQVDASDYSRIDNGTLTNATGWFNGDFNYDGAVNGTDYTLIDNAFNMQGETLAAEIAPPATSPAAIAIAKSPGRSRPVSFAPSIFSTGSPITLAEPADAAGLSIEQLLQKKDVLDGLLRSSK